MELFEGNTSFIYQEWGETKTIPGRIITQAPTKGRPGTIFMGSSLGGHREFRDIQQEFAKRGFAAYAFSLPTAAPYRRSAENSSLDEWRKIAIRAYVHFVETCGIDIHRVAIYGRDGGAFPAIEIAEYIKARALILDNPVAYPKEMLSMNFGLNFDVAHLTSDWRSSSAFDLMANFGGAIYHFAAGYDMKDRPMHSLMQDKFRAVINDIGGKSENIADRKQQMIRTADYISISI